MEHRQLWHDHFLFLVFSELMGAETFLVKLCLPTASAQQQQLCSRLRSNRLKFEEEMQNRIATEIAQCLKEDPQLAFAAEEAAVAIKLCAAIDTKKTTTASPSPELAAMEFPQVQFVPNVCPFFNGEKYRIPSCFHHLIRNPLSRQDFKTFRKEFEREWPRTKTHRITHTNAIRLRRLMQTSLLLDKLRLRVAEFCDSHRTSFPSLTGANLRCFLDECSQRAFQAPFDAYYQSFCSF